jgi:hypothetical protein
MEKRLIRTPTSTSLWSELRSNTDVLAHRNDLPAEAKLLSHADDCEVASDYVSTQWAVNIQAVKQYGTYTFTVNGMRSSEEPYYPNASLCIA